MKARAVLLLIAAVFSMNGLPTGHAFGSDSRWYAGWTLQQCNVFSCGDPKSYGVSADITAPPDSLDATDPCQCESIAYWVSLGDQNIFQGNNWIQAGYILGFLPDASCSTPPCFAAQPTIYIEYNNIDGYYFQIVKAVNFNERHNVQVYDTGAKGNYYFYVDGQQVYSRAVPFAGFTMGQSSAMLEAFRRGLPASAHWYNLKYSDAPNNWLNWDQTNVYLTWMSAASVYSCTYAPDTLVQNPFNDFGTHSTPNVCAGGGGDPHHLNK